MARCARARCRSRRSSCSAIPLARGLVRLYASLAPLFRARRRREAARALADPHRRDRRAARPRLRPSGPWSIAGASRFAAARRDDPARPSAPPARRRAPCDRRAEARRLEATWEGAARPSRFSPRCGTNFAALAVARHVRRRPAAGRSARDGCVAGRRSRLLARADDGALAPRPALDRRRWRVFLLPGLGLQRLTTREPRLDETQVALRAVAAVLRLELA